MYHGKVLMPDTQELSAWTLVQVACATRNRFARLHAGSLCRLSIAGLVNFEVFYKVTTLYNKVFCARDLWWKRNVGNRNVHARYNWWQR